MTKIILSINAGSSSVKISAYLAKHRGAPQQLAEAQINGLTAPPVQLSYTRGDVNVLKNQEQEAKIEDQDAAFKFLLNTFTSDPELPELSTKADISVACHRVVHGGDYTTSKVITQDTYHHLEKLTDLAPLHNANSLHIIKSCMDELPGALNVAYFDSQFHSSIPKHICTYPIDPEIAKNNQLRKYGFHGISYSFITYSVASFLGKDPNDLSIIALHLGSGASACAIKNGHSWDTSMGLTPLAGLPGATRSGSVDPSLVFHYASDVGKLSPSSTKDLHISVAEEILNKQSGWKALTGTTNFGVIATSDKPECKLAFDLLVNRICGYVGSYYVALEGKVDALVFAGGIGEKSDKLRDAVVGHAACLGFEIDAERNAAKIQSVVQDVGKQGARHRTLVCLTDEQYEMARGCTEMDELWQ
ncbi:acetate kinase [Hypoxylon fragiforme]|uniref:acetate kinase n=1 Tax=Hypoxylon fragiforme TaxID=63214 RepID=UPI0020C6F6C2|nr:acetate kinase [Hypoxylon fragiforme]KAI2609780.1 acetate kinase [Hypoxylon fragiforme]